jgi:hypothetical protein
VVEREPPPGYLARARALATRAGAVLVFDEVKLGCRLHPGGYQAVCGVTPDLAVFGKALANGYPLAAVVGGAAVMDAARRAWISSTLASEGTALAAAHAVLDRHAREDVCGRLAHVGARLRAAVASALDDAGANGVCVAGLDPMFFLRFDDTPAATAEARETVFLTAARDGGVLFKRGAYDYAALAHDADAVDAVARAAAAGFSGGAHARRDRCVTGADAGADVVEQTARAAADALAASRQDEAARGVEPLAGPAPLVDAHAHFFHPRTPRGDWRELNAARLRAGERMGALPRRLGARQLGADVAHLLRLARGRRVRQRRDVRHRRRVPGSRARLRAREPERARPRARRDPARGRARRRGRQALGEPPRRRPAPRSDRRGGGALDLPILHHVWQWRRRDWPMQEASDGVELAVSRRGIRGRGSCSRTSAAAATTSTPSRRGRPAQRLSRSVGERRRPRNARRGARRVVRRASCGRAT